MTFSIGNLSSDFKNFAIGSNFLKAVSTNPFYAALVITIILLLVVAFTFRNVSLPKNDSLSSILMRTGVYSFGLVLLVMYSHNYYMEEKFGKTTAFGSGPSLAGTIGIEDIQINKTQPMSNLSNMSNNIIPESNPLPSFV
jgi:hypothetical protein